MIAHVFSIPSPESHIVSRTPSYVNKSIQSKSLTSESAQDWKVQLGLAVSTLYAAAGIVQYQLDIVPIVPLAKCIFNEVLLHD